MSQSETQKSPSADSPHEAKSSSSTPNGADGIIVDVDGGIEINSASDTTADSSGSSSTQSSSAPQNSSTPQSTPVVEVLSPEEFDPELDRYANMVVDRTQISLGLTGVSLKRTRMSGGSGQTQNEQPPVDDSGKSEKSTPATSQTSAQSSVKGSKGKAGEDPADGQGEANSAKTSPSSASSAAASAHPSPGTGQDSGEEPEFEDVQLFSQFLVGAVSFGANELMERIHYFDEEISKDPEEYDLDKQIDQVEENIETLFRYWVIGTLMWGERTALSLSYRTFQKSIDVGSFVWRAADRTTDNFLLRPVRKPLERLSSALHKDSQARIAEGQTVEKRGRVLAEQTVNDIISDFIDYLSDNPELMDLISDSGMGLAGNLMDSGRQIGAVTDTSVENVIRKIFRRPKRQDLPPSPFDGIPQTMYDPINQIESHEEKSAASHEKKSGG